MDKRIKKLVAQIKTESENELTPDEVEQQLEKIWHLGGQYKKTRSPNFDTEKNLLALKARIEKEKKGDKVVRLPFLRMAAAIAFLVFATVWLYTNYSNTYSYELLVNDSSTARSITLSDGTEIELQANSSLEYPNRFRKNSTREVQLKGDAHFKVNADPEHPFIIQMPTTQAKVVGTEFFIQSIESRETSVTVMEGKVLFLDKSNEQEILLQANEIGICRPGGILYQEPLQIEGPLNVNLRNQPLIRLFAQLERHHDWTIKVGNSIRDCLVTGTYDVNQPEKVMRRINDFSNFTVLKKENGTYEVTGSCQ